MKACFALATVIGLTSLASTAIAAPAIAEGNGIIHTTGSAGGRRIFVDGNTMGQTPQSVTVKCGAHTVRLGSNGRTESFDVPCGGEINVLAKLGEEGVTPAPATSTAAANVPAASAPATASSAAAPSASTTPSPSTSAETPAPAPLQTLPTKPSAPLTFAPASAGTPVGYKIVAGIGIAAAAVLYALRKRKGAAKKIRAKIDVLGRTSVGMRSELLVVDVEGTRLLVGMTPSAIQTLAVLETPEMGHGSVGELADDAPEKKLSRQMGILDDEADPPLVIRRLATGGSAAAAASAKASAPADRPSREIQALLANRRSSTRMPAVTPEMVAERREAIAATKSEAGERSSSETATGRMPRRRRSVTGMSSVAGQARGLLLSMDEPDADESDSPADAAPARKPVRLGEW